jgi:putative hydrolase of the HAD superfamily
MKDIRTGNAANEGKLKAIVFDMDNTLFDTVRAKMVACGLVAGHLGRDDGTDLFEYFTRTLWGFEDWRNIRDYMVDRDIFSTSGYFEACSIYEAEKLNALVMYPGVHEVIDELKATGISLAVLTDADMYHARRRLEKTGLIDEFDCMVTFEMTGRKKPDQAPFLHALRKLGREARETAMVGDSPNRDLVPAMQLGMLTVYARYGDRFADTRDEKDRYTTIDTIRDLPALLTPLIE